MSQYYVNNLLHEINNTNLRMVSGLVSHVSELKLLSLGGQELV